MPLVYELASIKWRRLFAVFFIDKETKRAIVAWELLSDLCGTTPRVDAEREVKKYRKRFVVSSVVGREVHLHDVRL